MRLAVLLAAAAISGLLGAVILGSGGIVVPVPSFFSFFSGCDSLASLSLSLSQVRVTILEIYREVVHDLLAPHPDRTSLQVREHPKWGFFVDGLRVAPCGSATRALDVIHGAMRARRTGTHAMNARSSRSHCMVTLFVDADGGGGGATFGSISLVDLAGSERPKATGSAGESLKEAGHINKVGGGWSR